MNQKYRRRQWHPTPVLLPGKSHGRRSLVGCSPWGREESDTTERLHFHFPLSCIGEGNGSPLQCSCLENPRDGGAWWAAVYGVAESRTRLTRLSSSNNIWAHLRLQYSYTQPGHLRFSSPHKLGGRKLSILNRLLFPFFTSIPPPNLSFKKRCSDSLRDKIRVRRKEDVNLKGALCCFATSAGNSTAGTESQRSRE